MKLIVRLMYDSCLSYCIKSYYSFMAKLLIILLLLSGATRCDTSHTGVEDMCVNASHTAKLPRWSLDIV
jgi:hypothetical protein